MMHGFVEMAACASTRMRMHLHTYVDELAFARAAASVCLVWPEHPVVLLGG